MEVYFAGYLRDIAGISGDIPDEINNSDKLLSFLSQKYPAMKNISIKISVNGELVKKLTSLSPDAEILVFTPLAGG
jgi:molybdopterin converting factor small subunit